VNTGASLSISATPGTGYQFAGFSGAITGTTTPQTVTVNGPLTVSANFTAIRPDFTLTTDVTQQTTWAGSSTTFVLSK
jgi:hypothetical protein